MVKDPHMEDRAKGEENGVVLSTKMPSLAALNDDNVSNLNLTMNGGKVISASGLRSRGGGESEDLSDDEASDEDEGTTVSGKYEEIMAPKILDSGNIFEHDEEGEPQTKKRKPLSSLAVKLRTSNPNSERPTPESNGSCHSAAETPETMTASVAKKYKKKSNLWSRSARKGRKRQKNTACAVAGDDVFIDPIPKPQNEKIDDSEGMGICLSKVFKAERVELSEDRMEAGSNMGYRMVRATRGVLEGAWYFEIKVICLGESGHTRLGWSTDRGDLQAPVGYDRNSFGYRDIDGCRIHNAVREKYGDGGYGEGDVIGFYISLPEGSSYAPSAPHFVFYKGRRYCTPLHFNEDPPKTVPGSEISFFKNGVSQGVAFKELYGGRYFPAASLYTLPKQPNCIVKFNFGPDFEFYPETFDDRPLPRPMSEVPYYASDINGENGITDERKCYTGNDAPELSINTDWNIVTKN